MTAQQWHSVASGKPYPVTVVPDGESGSLEQFAGDAEFCIDGGGQELHIRGHGVRHGEVVRFHEKSAAGGKDVRVWLVREQGGGFVAETVSAF
ncbi:hypothetical protein [Modestobacter versicolor]|uniref:hypothetical protein n=1 Tax=Modestobacter versicolor TaxID=429133 RepID=UPI0034DEDE85